MRMHDFRRGSRTARSLGILAATIPLVAVRPASADLMLDFDSTTAAYITFTGGGAFDATADIGGVETTLQLGHSYSISDLSDGVDVTEYNSGRVFVSLGAPLTGLTPSNSYAPDYAAPQNNPNFLTRFDKYEINYVNGTGGANLSSADFFGIPLQLRSTGGGPTASPKTLTWYNSNTRSVFSGLGTLANGTTDTIADTSGAIVTGGSNGLTVTVNTTKGPETLTGVVRVIAPGSVNPGSGETTPFPSFQKYVAYLQTGGPGSTPITATIAGANGQTSSAGPFQNYSFTAFISNTVQTINNVAVNPGDLIVYGTVSNSDNPITILIQKQYLTDYAIYGAAVAKNNTTVVGGDPNAIVEKVLGDYFSGLNFGLIGSTVPNPTTNADWNGKPLGQSPSWTWYGNIPDGVGGPGALPLADVYSYAQPNNPYYNQYAAYLNDNASGEPVTDSYGFPFTDRLASPLAPLDDNTTLTLTVLDEGSGLGGAPVPEPSTWAMMFMGFVGLGLVGRRVLRKSEARA
jgi:hypothetical protein